MAATAAAATTTEKNGMSWLKIFFMPVWLPFFVTKELLLLPFRAVRAGWNNKLKAVIALVVLYVYSVFALAVLGKMGTPEATRVLSTPIGFLMFPLKGIWWLLVDNWHCALFYWSKFLQNWRELAASDGDQGTAFSTLLRWTIGGATIWIVTWCETVGYWVENGACARFIAIFAGAKAMALMLLPNIGVFNFSLGGGGHSKGGGGGGHH